MCAHLQCLRAWRARAVADRALAAGAQPWVLFCVGFTIHAAGADGGDLRLALHDVYARGVEPPADAACSNHDELLGGCAERCGGGGSQGEERPRLSYVAVPASRARARA